MIKYNEQAARPPWALPEEDFRNKCSQCARCIEVCPEKILFKGKDGFPLVDFKSTGCTFCGKCAVVCDDMALLRRRGARAWEITVKISDVCLAIQGIACTVCGDTCQENAIRFDEVPGATPQPDIEKVSCTGCGFCVNPCPVQAVTVS